MKKNNMNSTPITARVLSNEYLEKITGGCFIGHCRR